MTYGRCFMAGVIGLLLLLVAGSLPSHGDQEQPAAFPPAPGETEQPTAIMPCPAPSGALSTALETVADPPVPTPVSGWGTPLPADAVPTPTAVLPSSAPARAAAGPSVVEVRGEPYDYKYYVNGEPVVIRGMGYNVAYRAWGWDCAARARRYDRDFAAMRAVGVNTLVGWDEGEFDDLTMAKAAEYGLGVIFPYDFPPDVDWADPAEREIHRQRVETRVRRYAGHPALRMWGLGNEVMYLMGGATSARAQAFGEFFAELAEEVHALDPIHPIIYRDSEDLYLAPVQTALRARGLEQPWMVYGMTIFSLRLESILDEWPSQDFRVPLLVSEFNVADYPREERAAGLMHMWDVIRDHRAYVLGGSVYAWTTEGLETSDATIFGLVDNQNRPVDGALEALQVALSAP